MSETLLGGIDFDEVLFPLIFNFRIYLEKKHHLQVKKWEDIKEMTFAEVTGWDHSLVQELFNILIDNPAEWKLFHDEVCNQETFLSEIKEAQQVLSRIKNELNFKFCIVTARSKKESFEVVDRLCKAFLPGIITDGYIFCEQFNRNPQIRHRTKKEACQENDIQVLVDDMVKHLNMLDPELTYPILFGQNPWTLEALGQESNVDYHYAPCWNDVFFGFVKARENFENGLLFKSGICD